MRENNRQQAPSARREGLIVRKLSHETLVYDTERQIAHCLNHNATLIWENCDGKRSVDELCDLFDGGDNLSRNQKEQIVRIALNELAKSHLLKTPTEEFQAMKGLSRRELIKAACITLIAIPAISTIVAPRSAEASTCLASGQSCTTSAECCSGLCSVNACS